MGHSRVKILIVARVPGPVLPILGERVGCVMIHLGKLHFKVITTHVTTFDQKSITAANIFKHFRIQVAAVNINNIKMLSV